MLRILLCLVVLLQIIFSASSEDEAPNSREKRQIKSEPYAEYMEELKLRMKFATCECPPKRHNQRRRKRSAEEPESGVERHGASATTDFQNSPVVATHLHPSCHQDNMTETQRVFAGICVFSEPGKLVFGVRQWHGLTSLVCTLIITPLSIFIARYHKSYYSLRDGKLPLRTWYLVHILLIFPCVWMHASGFAALSRQKEVLGHSFTTDARIHRGLGMLALAMMGVQIFSGIIRPLSVTSRKVVIYLHWLGGYFQHGLEVYLCVFSCLIPASPTSAHSLLNNKRFGKPMESSSTELFIGWLIFSLLVHLFQMCRICIQDRSVRMQGRSYFPILIPILAVSQAEMDMLQKQAWIENVVLIIYSLVSAIVFFIVSVTMYQIFYDKNYYGFGPMSCSHKSETELYPPDEIVCVGL